MVVFCRCESSSSGGLRAFCAAHPAWFISGCRCSFGFWVWHRDRCDRTLCRDIEPLTQRLASTPTSHMQQPSTPPKAPKTPDCIVAVACPQLTSYVTFCSTLCFLLKNTWKPPPGLLFVLLDLNFAHFLWIFFFCELNTSFFSLEVCLFASRW